MNCFRRINFENLHSSTKVDYRIYHLLLLPCYYVFPSLVNLYGLPLLLLIVFHITTILLAKKEGMNTYPQYIGIIVT